MKQKRILILGGGYSTVEVVKYAKELGLYTIVTSNEPSGAAKAIADETLMYSTDDVDNIVKYVKQSKIDGIFTGASEFHIVNMIQICEKCGLPCYATLKQWEICQNKHLFKSLCRKCNVPCVAEYDINSFPGDFDFPVIVKPVDGCSARGISVCNNKLELQDAYDKALQYSLSKKIIIEKYIENGGTTLSVRYIVVDGELYLEAVGDRYVLDADNGKALITAAAFYPSKHTEFYISEVDQKVKNMFKALGLKNGALFMEGIYKTNLGVVFYEMGLRISGGMTYKITEITNGVNELKMLIGYAVNGKMCEESDLAKIEPHLNGNYTASITLPLNTGKISEIKGLDAVKSLAQVYFIQQYYYEGDTIMSKYIGTLDQLLARVTLICHGKSELFDTIKFIKSNVSVIDESGSEMIIYKRLDQIIKDYGGSINE